MVNRKYYRDLLMKNLKKEVRQLLELNLYLKIIVLLMEQMSDYNFGIQVTITIINIHILAGCEKYRAITTGHYRNAVGAILVYDISNEESFFNLGYWLENLREYAEEHIVIALMANKCDIMFKRPEDREVMKE